MFNQHEGVTKMRDYDNITMATSEERILVDDIVQHVVCEASDQVPEIPSPKQIGGLTNLGKTFIWSEAELEDKRKYAEAQMV